MANKSHPNYYNEAYHRGEVEKEQWGRKGQAIGTAVGTVGAAHYIGKMPIPQGGYKEYLSSLKGIVKHGGDSVTITGSGVSNGAEGITAASGSLTVKGDRLGAVAKETERLVRGNKASVNDTIKHLDEAAKTAAKGGDEAAKTAKSLAGKKNLLRAGKWGAAIAAGITVGAVAKKITGDMGRSHGVSSGPRDEQSWVAKEDARRAVTVNLEQTR